MIEKPTKKIQKYYDQRWSEAMLKPINKLELKRLIAILQMIEKIEKENEMKILDLGCGRGWLSSILSHIGTTIGIELSPEAVSASQERYNYIEFRSGDMFKVLTEKDTYDLVVSQEVIEHVEDQSAFVNLVADSLKLGGHFVFTTPNAYTQDHRTQEEHKRWGLQPIENWIDRKQIIKLLVQRFEVIEIRSIIDGFGTTGIFRIANSYKLRKLLSYLRISSLYSYFILKFGYGLHLVAHGRRRI